MSKKLPPDFMETFISGKDTAPARPTDERPRDAAEYGKFKRSELVTFSIRMRAEDLAALRAHFKRIDVPLSQGVRQVMLDYMAREGLR